MTCLSLAEIADRVRCLRETVMVGSCIDMLPYEPEYDAEVVRLRSLSNVRYFMNLIDEPTLAGQVVWREGYGAREDDVMWLIRDKLGRICGTNRLYDINPRTAEKGSQIVEPEIARALPAALESDVTIIETAFNTFNVEKITAIIREDNVQVKTMNERFGFVSESESEIREVRYVKYVLTREAWNPSPYRAILEHWARRYA